MQPRNQQSNVTYDTKHFSIVFTKILHETSFIPLIPIKMKFYCAQLWDIFEQYLDQSFNSKGAGPLSYLSEYVKTRDKENQTITFRLRHPYIGEISIEPYYLVMKFLFETNLHYAKVYIEQLRNNYISEDKLTPDSLRIYNFFQSKMADKKVGYFGYTRFSFYTIPLNVMSMMNMYNSNKIDLMPFVKHALLLGWLQQDSNPNLILKSNLNIMPAPRPALKIYSFLYQLWFETLKASIETTILPNHNLKFTIKDFTAKIQFLICELKRLEKDKKTIPSKNDSSMNNQLIGVPVNPAENDSSLNNQLIGVPVNPVCLKSGISTGFSELNMWHEEKNYDISDKPKPPVDRIPRNTQ